MTYWKNPPPPKEDEFDCLYCEAGETETMYVRVEIMPPETTEASTTPGYATGGCIWTGDGWLTGFSHLLPSFVERIEVHAWKVYTGQITMACTDMAIQKQLENEA